MLTCAPDTLLGGGIQTCRKLIDNGLIGTPVASVGQTFNGGPESWHPNPFFLYQKGAGPLYDVGPYYIGGILYLLGPAGEVACMAKKTYAQRTIGSQPHCGEKIDVEMPTYYACTMHLNSGAICTSLHSFDVPCSRLDTRIEIYGTEGTLITVPPCDFRARFSFGDAMTVPGDSSRLSFPMKRTAAASVSAIWRTHSSAAVRRDWLPISPIIHWT